MLRLAGAFDLSVIAKLFFKALFFIVSLNAGSRVLSFDESMGINVLKRKIISRLQCLTNGMTGCLTRP